ncbi:MAG: RsmD family RNA methyltransferase [Spirochaetaceae bacterium]|nr:RsmD family RNA methyltransferase [Spirochaetaceae bacterium]
MRITGGKYRGRIVDVPKGPLEIRPAMDRMRESVFAVLGDLTGLSFLDLFAGSGIIGLEAASRGASPVACVEKDPAKFALLLRNAAIASERIDCKSMPVERFLLRNPQAFDVVFCDPPFPYKFRRDLLERIGSGRSCSPGALILIHHPSEDPLPDLLGPLRQVDRREYGRSIVCFYRKEPPKTIDGEEIPA